MNAMIKRNLKLFFRDKSAVFFSLLSVIIIIGLYVVFLGKNLLDGAMAQLKSPENLMNNWLVAGILAVASVTTTLSAFGVMIDDKSKKISKDFNSSPIKRSSILTGYLGSSFLIGVIMSLITLIIAQAYMLIQGGSLLPVTEYIKVFLLILLTVLMNTSIVCFVVSFFESHNAFSTASTVIGTLIGFITGIYLPIGSLPDSVQTAIKVFPVSHAASLFRQIMMKPSIEESFAGIPPIYLDEFNRQMGVTFYFGSFEVTPAFSIAVLVLTSVVFYGLSLGRMLRKK